MTQRLLHFGSIGADEGKSLSTGPQHTTLEHDILWVQNEVRLCLMGYPVSHSHTGQLIELIDSSVEHTWVHSVPLTEVPQLEQSHKCLLGPPPPPLLPLSFSILVS